MEKRVFRASLQSALYKRNIFLLMAIGLLMVVILLSVALMKSTGNTRLVLVPMPLKQIGWLDKQSVSDSYLAEMTRYMSFLFLNASLETALQRREEILHYAAPESYGSLKDFLIAEEEDIKHKHIHTWFSPNSVSTNTKTFTADIEGDLHILVGKEEIQVIRITYRAQYTYHNGLLLISKFNEVEKDASLQKNT